METGRGIGERSSALCLGLKRDGREAFRLVACRSFGDAGRKFLLVIANRRASMSSVGFRWTCRFTQPCERSSDVDDLTSELRIPTRSSLLPELRNVDELRRGDHCSIQRLRREIKKAALPRGARPQKLLKPEKDYQCLLLAKVSFSVRGKDQRGFLVAGRALISIGSPVKGLVPLPALRALTSLRTRAPMTGKRTRSPPAAALAPLLKAFSIAVLRSARLMRTSPWRVTSAEPQEAFVDFVDERVLRGFFLSHE